MTDPAQAHCTRPWYLRPPVWFISVGVVLLIAFAVFVSSGRPPATLYSAFLDQLNAGNVASITFRGTEIHGTFKQAVTAAGQNGSASLDTFRSRVPEIGDPSLIPALRQQHVVIDVASSSQWASWLGRLPWPMVFILGAVLFAGLLRLLCGGKSASVSPLSMHPMGGMMGLVLGLFGKQQAATEPPPYETGDKSTKEHS
jgi:ATP-dependent Zn protease